MMALTLPLDLVPANILPAVNQLYYFLSQQIDNRDTSLAWLGESEPYYNNAKSEKLE